MRGPYGLFMRGTLERSVSRSVVMVVREEEEDSGGKGG